MSHTTSRTWISDEAREYELWSKVREGLARLSPNSPFTPKSFSAWIRHKIAKKEEDRNKTKERIAQKERDNEESPAPVQPSFAKKEFGDHLTPTLARESIWRPSTEPSPGIPSAPWPTSEEFKHEGDDRSKSGYSRFPPLPRDPGNETVNWKQRKPLPQRPFDQVGLPSMNMAGSAVNQSEDSTTEAEYIGESLLRSLDD